MINAGERVIDSGYLYTISLVVSSSSSLSSSLYYCYYTLIRCYHSQSATNPNSCTKLISASLSFLQQQPFDIIQHRFMCARVCVCCLSVRLSVYIYIYIYRHTYTHTYVTATCLTRDPGNGYQIYHLNWPRNSILKSVTRQNEQ